MTDSRKFRVEFSVEMDGQTYLIRLGTNQLCQIEEQTKKSWGDILYRDLSQLHLNVTTLRLCVQIGSVAPITLDVAGDLVDTIGFAGMADSVKAAIVQQLVDAEADVLASVLETKAADVH